MLVWALWLIVKSFRAGADQKRTAFFVRHMLPASSTASASIPTSPSASRRSLFLLFIPFFKKNLRILETHHIFLAITIIVAAPIGWYFATNPGSFFGRTAEIAVTAAANPAQDFAVNIMKEALMFNYHGDYNWRQNISGAPELFWPVGILFLLGIVLVVYFWIRRARKKYITAENEKLFPLFGTLLVFAWLIFGILPAAASDEGIPHALRSILALAPALILATLGGVWLYRIIKKHWGAALAKSLMVIFLIVVAGWGYYDYFVAWAQNPNVPRRL